MRFRDGGRNPRSRGLSTRAARPYTNGVAIRAETAPTRGPGPVLVVEDHGDARDGVISILRAVGYEAIGAANGPDALTLLRTIKAKPALILLDLMMPEMAGWQVRERVRECPGLADVPVILMSGYEHTLETIQNGPAPAAAALRKPLDPDELLRAVARHIAR